MPIVQSSLRAALLGGAAAVAFTSAVVFSGAALAGDKSATPEGAKKIADAIANFVGKSSAASVAVAPAGDHYGVTFDIASINSAITASHVTYDSAPIKLDVYEQDDGAWRMEQKSVPPITGHVTRAEPAGGTMDFTIRLDNAHYTVVYDPTLSWLRSGHASHDKGAVDIKGPGLTETIGLGALTADLTTKVGADGRVASMLNEALANFDITFDVDPKVANPQGPADAQPVHIAAKAEGAKIGVRVDNLQPQPLLALWVFYTAHPTRPELAANQDRFKSLLSDVLADQATFDETFSMDKLTVDTPKGQVSIAGASVEVGGANKGAASGFSERIAATGLTLPESLAPAAFKDFLPSSFEIGFQATGFDLAAAGAEWIADLHLERDGPPLSNVDRGKVGAKFLAGGPVKIELTPTRIDAPRLKLGLDGQVAIDQGHPIGKITLKAQDFDKTVEALQALGPEMQQKITPVIAMAKGLAKTDANGVMTWIGEVGADKVLKVNGLPLGKSPF